MSRRWLKKYTRDRSRSPLRFIAKLFRARVAPNATAPDMPETPVDSLTLSVTAEGVRIVAPHGSLTLPGATTTAWLSRALLRAALDVNAEHIVERDRVAVAAKCWTRANGLPAVVINAADALFILSGGDACRLAVALLDLLVFDPTPPALYEEPEAPASERETYVPKAVSPMEIINAMLDKISRAKRRGHAGMSGLSTEEQQMLEGAARQLREER